MPKKRQHQEIAYDEPPETPKKATAKPKTPKKSPIRPFEPPANWRETYDILSKFRYTILPPAPVDTIGCDQLHDNQATPAIQRFQILVSLMLSSQTKDEVTAEAVRRLRTTLKNKSGTTELSVESILSSSSQQINGCINKVGFHRRKTEYLQKAAQILERDHYSDIPETAEGLMELPGVGPKMAYLAMQAAWKKNEGIGVDTHVHRISSRLKWVPPGTEEKGPEMTRAYLESWLPRELWPEINHLLVGLGQLVCLPRNPKCADCLLNSTCPSAKIIKTKKAK